MYSECECYRWMHSGSATLRPRASLALSPDRALILNVVTEGGDVIYDRPDDDYEWKDGKSRPGDHDGHHGDHPGDPDGHHGDHPGHHDGHHGDHPIDPTGDGRPDDGDHGRPEPTERPPPIDYIGTRPPLIGRPEDGHDDHGNDDDTDDSSEDHDGRPHHGDDDDTDDSSEDHDGRPHHGNDDGEDDDDDKINHRNMNNPPFRSISQWKSERAGREKMVAQRRPIQARPAYQGRSRVETEEARYGHDYGHSGKQYRKSA
ncbi:hypothetical protein BSL78_16614 [Apostichopus japonicus]|uniref:Uncharacterized protein n=1 Tax=Stichopus japonicus TaxID=307972 RepID=A0A2G8KEV4_STIJA|nr:hypothetical protein BSL78_16614 [Apostichopus japonicus]